MNVRDPAALTVKKAVRSPHPSQYTHLDIARRTHCRGARSVTSEGRPAVRYRTAVVVPPARYEVILVSRGARRRLRGRSRTMSATNI